MSVLFHFILKALVYEKVFEEECRKMVSNDKLQSVLSSRIGQQDGIGDLISWTSFENFAMVSEKYNCKLKLVFAPN